MLLYFIWGVSRNIFSKQGLRGSSEQNKQLFNTQNPVIEIGDINDDNNCQKFTKCINVDIDGNIIGHEEQSASIKQKNKQPQYDVIEIKGKYINIMGIDISTVYKSKDHFSHGGHSTIYISYIDDKLNNQKIQIVIKKIKKEWVKSEELGNNLITNIKEHENILKIFCTYKDQANNEFYVFMEYCPLGSLEKFMKCAESYDKLNTIQKLNIIYQIACGLKHLHDNKIIHRDIKPENILLKQNDITKEIILLIADFGIASNETNGNELIGTPLYVPPEVVALATEYSDKVDVWSFGILIYFLFKRERLFYGKTQDDIIFNILFQTIVIKEDNNMPQEIKALITNMIKRDPNERINIIKVVSELETIIKMYQENKEHNNKEEEKSNQSALDKKEIDQAKKIEKENNSQEEEKVYQHNKAIKQIEQKIQEKQTEQIKVKGQQDNNFIYDDSSIVVGSDDDESQ